MLNVEVQLDVKMDPAIDDRRSLIGPLGSLLATLFAVAALHAENASTKDQRLSIEKPIKSCRGFLLTKSGGLISIIRSFRQPSNYAQMPPEGNSRFWAKRPEMGFPHTSVAV